MKLTVFGWLAVLIGLAILGIAFLNGFNLILMGVGFFFLVVGGNAKATKSCAFCKSKIDPTATVCPKCTREQPARK